MGEFLNTRSQENICLKATPSRKVAESGSERESEGGKGKILSSPEIDTMGLHTASHLLLYYNRNTPAAYAIEHQDETSKIQHAVMDIAPFRIPSRACHTTPGHTRCTLVRQPLIKTLTIAETQSPSILPAMASASA